MKLKNCREAYDYFSGKTSEIIRYLGFVGLALVWIFRVENNNTMAVPKGLVVPSFLLILGLTFDLLHYLTATIIWGCYHRYKEKKVDETNEFKVPPQLNWGTNILFYAKICIIGLAYVLLLRFLYSKFW
ncbi:hypothetical protein KAR91_65780 [Candidatus Pacearchaeota archaeon]|nr:hypothetical protein [Candidatus Pacearchaeota archaeon]